MSDQSKREYHLRQLLEDNFIVSNLIRKVAEGITDVPLKNYFLDLSNKRNQFAIELSGELAFYGGQKPFFPPNAYDRRWTRLAGADHFRLIKKFLKLNKQSREKYRMALSQVNDGNCREVIIRHKSYIENSLFELKSLKKLLKYSREQLPSQKNQYETS